MANRRRRRTRPIVLYPRFTRPAPEYAADIFDVSAFKSAPPLTLTIEETEDLTTCKTPKANRRRRRRRPAG